MSHSVSALGVSVPARSPALFRAAGSAGRALAAQLDAEQGRWFLWLPVFFGAGVGIYFELLDEPDFTLSLGIFVAALALRMLARAHLSAFLFTSILLCVSAGFFAAKLRTDIVAENMLERHGAYDLEGFVEGFDRQSPKRGRAIVRLSSMKHEGEDVAKRPFRVRVSVRGEQTLVPGSAVKLRAMLGPPPEPVMPGGYDFARMSFYQGIGASGYSLSKPEVLEERELPLDMKFRTRLAELRAWIGRRIIHVLPGQTGEIAAALTVGQTAGLDDTSMRDLRGSGLAHIYSISGLHMSLVAGTVFWFLRWSLALFPFIALRFSDADDSRRRGPDLRHHLSRALGCGHRGGALIYYDRGRVSRDPLESARAVAAQRGARRPADPDRAAGQPDRPQLPDVFRRDRRTDRRL